MAEAMISASVLERPGRSIVLPFPPHGPPRTVAHIMFSDDDPGKSSTNVRVSVRLYLSQRVLMYVRHKIWAARVSDDEVLFKREPNDVSARNSCAAKPHDF
jgi:Cft2 family RNA processing exonuclease